MATNQSVKKLQASLDGLPSSMREAIIRATFYQASRLARAMMFAAPRGATTDLRESIRVEQGRRPARALVRAGGPKTTVGGYDYALANEFGTAKMAAQPFFWSTYRAERKRIRHELEAAVIDALNARRPRGV
jgi:HK97 gp10 family phage protein